MEEWLVSGEFPVIFQLIKVTSSNFWCTLAESTPPSYSIYFISDINRVTVYDIYEKCRDSISTLIER